MTRQCNRPYDLDKMNSDLETIMQEQEKKQSGWNNQRFVKRTMYMHRFYPSGCCHVELPFQSRYILNIHNNDNQFLLLRLIAYLHPAKANAKRDSK